MDVSPGYLRNYLAPSGSPSPRPTRRSPPPCASASAPRRPPASRRSARRRPPRCSARRCSPSPTARARTAACSGRSPRRRSRTPCARHGAEARPPQGAGSSSRSGSSGTHMVEIEVAPGVTASVKTMVVEANDADPAATAPPRFPLAVAPSQTPRAPWSRPRTWRPRSRSSARCWSRPARSRRCSSRSGCARTTSTATPTARSTARSCR